MFRFKFSVVFVPWLDQKHWFWGAKGEGAWEMCLKCISRLQVLGQRGRGCSWHWDMMSFVTLPPHIPHYLPNIFVNQPTVFRAVRMVEPICWKGDVCSDGFRLRADISISTFWVSRSATEGKRQLTIIISFFFSLQKSLNREKFPKI